MNVHHLDGWNILSKRKDLVYFLQKMRLRMTRVIKYIKKPSLIIYRFAAKGIIPMSDKMYLRKIFKENLNYELDLDNPRTFNEKLQWLKLYDRNPKYTEMVDKYAVKKYVAGQIGEQYIIPTLGVWDKFDDIDFENLPHQFVLKCTHDSGSIVICKEKDTLNINQARKIINRALKRNFYYMGREWPYKNVVPRVIAEKYISEDSGKNLEHKMAESEELIDYKFMCFNGEVRCLFVCSERYSDDGLKVTFFDREWNVLPFQRHYPKSQKVIPKPAEYDRMLDLAEHLAVGIPFIRVDFYEVNGKVYFGELTFFPGCGLEEFKPETVDKEFGDWIRLPLERN